MHLWFRMKGSSSEPSECPADYSPVPPGSLSATGAGRAEGAEGTAGAGTAEGAGGTEVMGAGGKGAEEQGKQREQRGQGE